MPAIRTGTKLPVDDAGDSGETRHTAIARTASMETREASAVCVPITGWRFPGPDDRALRMGKVAVAVGPSPLFQNDRLPPAHLGSITAAPVRPAAKIAIPLLTSARGISPLIGLDDYGRAGDLRPPTR
jgi:hypothetical protein